MMPGLLSHLAMEGHPMKRTIAAASVTALTAGLLYGAVAPAVQAEEASPRADGGIAGIETVGPIATVPSQDGERWPTPPAGVAVMPRGTVLNGAFPLVYIPALRTVDTIDARVRELSAARPDTAVVDEGRAESGWFTGRVTLKVGAEYAVDVRKSSGKWASVGTFNVSGKPESAGPSVSSGSVTVSQVTGQVSWGWSSRELAGPTEGRAMGLSWVSGRTGMPGVPDGWRLSASSDSPWMAIEESPVDVEAVDVPAAPAVTRLADSRLRVDFAYPAAEARLLTRFVVEGRDAKGRWKVLARPNRTFASADVDVVVSGGDVTHVRVGAVAEGTTIWGPAARIRRSAAPITSAPEDRHLAGASSGSLATPGDQPSVVRLVGWDGSRLTFVRNPLGVYEQMGGQTPGFANGLTSIQDGEWEFAALDGTVTRFVDGSAVSVTVKGAPTTSFQWSGGRLSRIVNEVGRGMVLHYSGDSACPVWAGFAAAPAGMLCAITHPGGERTQIGYVRAGGGVQIALIKDPGNTGETLGWDDRGRLVSTRSALVSQVGTIDPSVLGVVTSIKYDSSGRAAVLVDAPGAVGAASLTKSIDFPSIAEAQLRDWIDSGNEADAARATVTGTGGTYSLVRTAVLDPVTWRTLRVSSPAGLSITSQVDERTGHLEKAVDALGRVTTYKSDELGQVTAVTGPSTSATMATENSTTYDTRREGGKDKPLAGLRAQVYERDMYVGQVTSEFWESDYSRGGLSGTWSGRGSQFSAQASGVWTPSDADDAAGARLGWDFEVTSSGGADVSLVVGGVICAVSSTICRVEDLPKGPKAVTIQISDAPASGWFAISAAPRGDRPTPIGFDEVRPGYGLATVATTNDDLPGGTDVSRTEYVFANPATGQVSSVKSPGGLVTRLDYERAEDGDGGWGRLLTRTTPGGLTQATSYWPDAATVSLPGVCGGAQVQVSGEPRTMTRQDGTTVTMYFDIAGRIRATETAAGALSEVRCQEYAAGGALTESSTYVGERLHETTRFISAVGGDPRVTRITYTRGAAASQGAGETRSETVTVDLLGRPIQEVGLGGDVTQTTYDAAGQVATTVITAPEGSRVDAQRFDFAYSAETGLLASVLVNGVRAATLTRDAGTGQVTSIDYAGAASVGWGYAPDGRVDSITASAGGLRVSDSLTMEIGGRISGRSVDVSGAGSGSVDRGYVYDAAGHLSKATFTGDAESVFEYEHGAQAPSCASSYSGAGRDHLRTGGSRNGVDYDSCYDARGRLVSTTDPLVAGQGGAAEVTYDALGRVDRITGPRALAASWSLGTEISRLDEISADGSDLVSTRWRNFGGRVLDKTLVTDAGTSTVRYAGVFVLAVADDSVTGVTSVQYGLPGGASIVTAPGASATLTIPGTDGSALVRVDVAALGSGAAPAPGVPVGVAATFGPYGEPLVAPSIAGASPIPTYSWQAAAGQETLPGTTSVTVLGDRPYHPALGAFLAPDPVIDSGDNLYSYTDGDPINSHDVTGRESGSESVMLGVFAGISMLVALGAGFAMGRSVGLGQKWVSRQIKKISYGAIGATAIFGGTATYFAMKGQDGDVATAVVSALGIAAIATGGAALMAKWGTVRGKHLLAARKLAQAKAVMVRQIADAGLDPSLVQGAATAIEKAKSLKNLKGIKDPVVKVLAKERGLRQNEKFLAIVAEQSERPSTGSLSGRSFSEADYEVIGNLLGQ